MKIIEYTRMVMNSSHEYFSSLLLILAYWLLRLYTVSLHSVILGCFGFHGLVPDQYRYLTCITSFYMDLHQSVTHEPFFPSFEHLMSFVWLTEGRGNSFSLPTSACHTFHKPLLIIASAARGPDLVAVTWSLFHTHLLCSSLSMSPSSQILSEGAQLELLAIFDLSNTCQWITDIFRYNDAQCLLSFPNND